MLYYAFLFLILSLVAAWLGFAAAAGKPSFAVLSPGGARATPDQVKAAALGFKIATFPTAMLSPAIGGMMAGLAAIRGGASAAESALPEAQFRETLGYAAYDRQAASFIPKS